MAEQGNKRLVKKLKEEVILDTDPETVVFDTRQQFPPKEIAARNWLPKIKFSEAQHL
jgi:hypothetical protein